MESKKKAKRINREFFLLTAALLFTCSCVLMICACSKESEPPKKPAFKTPAPVTKLPAPVVKAPAPITKTASAVTKTPVSVTKTVASVTKQQPAPITKTASPVTKLPAPVTRTTAPITQTSTDKGRMPDQKPEPVPDKSQQQVATEFNYDPVGKPDPFEPLVRDIPASKAPAPVEPSGDTAALTPLQKYDLSELNLVAIITQDNNSPVAMVEDKAGYGYIIKTGMLIGKYDGVIQEINQDSVVIIEKIGDPSGKAQVKTTTLRIYKSEKGEK